MSEPVVILMLDLGEPRCARPGLEITSCVGHPNGRGYRDPANRDIWRCIECEEISRPHATLHLLDYPDLTDATERRRLSSRLHQRRMHSRRATRSARARVAA
jgi:hypothetical protein